MEQIPRALKVAGGFVLLLLGVVMLVTPGPGWLAIAGGVGILATEYVWARRLRERLGRLAAAWSMKKN